MKKEDKEITPLGSIGFSHFLNKNFGAGEKPKWEDITQLTKDLNTFYDKFHRKGDSVLSTPTSLTYKNIPFGLAKDFKLECDKIILENSLNLKSDLLSENGVFLNQCVISEKD